MTAGTVFCHDSHCPNDVTRSVFAMATGGGGRGSATTPGFSRGAEIPVETLFVWRWEGWLNTRSWEGRYVAAPDLAYEFEHW